MGRFTAKDFDREISHDEAEKAAMAFINEHFKNPGKEYSRTCIPAEPTDSDIVLCAYIRQQRKREQVTMAAELNQPASQATENTKEVEHVHLRNNG